MIQTTIVQSEYQSVINQTNLKMKKISFIVLLSIVLFTKLNAQNLKND